MILIAFFITLTFVIGLYVGIVISPHPVKRAYTKRTAPKKRKYRHSAAFYAKHPELIK